MFLLFGNSNSILFSQACVSPFFHFHLIEQNSVFFFYQNWAFTLPHFDETTVFFICWMLSSQLEITNLGLKVPSTPQKGKLPLNTLSCFQHYLLHFQMIKLEQISFSCLRALAYFSSLAVSNDTQLSWFWIGVICWFMLLAKFCNLVMQTFSLGLNAYQLRSKSAMNI